MLKEKILHKLLMLVYCWIISLSAIAQCVSPTLATPYQEDFETNDGNWFTGGVSSDWAWGSPSKPLIRNAGSGNNCWIVGGLTGNNYANGEASWLQSPCFDFSALKYPYISFVVFWETESRFDGANLQYSLDQGNTWINLGATSDAANCLNSNWYNFSSITYLAPVSPVKEGWSGNIQSTVGNCQGGNGRGGWILAQKTMPYLAGESDVVFRFTFGAGTVCNSYDGFAIDKITIGEAPANDARFTYSCLPGNTVNFLNTSLLCPQKFVWDFGDAASGNNNTSVLQNPSHTFSTPGTYTVTFTVNGPDNEADTTTQNITILSLNASVTAAIKCFGDSNGAVGVAVTGAPGPFNYNWNSTPPQATATAMNLPQGLYTINVTAPNVCPATASIQLSQPMALTHSLAVVQPGCNNPNGSISIAETGGTPPYNYSWSPAVSTGPIAVGLLPGLYITTVTDSRMCPDIINTNISAAVTPVVDISNHTNVTCKGGNNGTATATMQAANGPVSYSWNTSPVQLTATATGLKAGIYIVTMTDINGCTATDSVAITEPLSSLSTDTTIINTSCGLPNGNIILSPTGGVSPYQFTWSPLISTGANSGNIYSGNYGVTVTDSAGCSIILNNLNVINTGTPALPNLGRDTIICANQTLVLNPGTFSTYLWQNNSMAPTFNVTQSGQYFVTVTNAGGCTAKDSVLVQVQPDCSDVYFPTSFTPNGDLRNDMFGVIGNIGLISNYKLLVYNRYGELVFYTTNPSVKWNGNYKTTNPVAASYAWYATYIFRGTAKRMKYGTVTLIK